MSVEQNKDKLSKDVVKAIYNLSELIKHKDKENNANDENEYKLEPKRRGRPI